MSSSTLTSLESSNQQKTRMFHEKLAILNENFVRFVRNAYEKQPSADFTPTLQDYLKHVRDLDSMYAENQTTIPISNAPITRTATTKGVAQTEFSSLFGSKTSSITTTTSSISTLTFGHFSATTTTTATNATSTSPTATFSFGLSNASTTAIASSFPALTSAIVTPKPITTLFSHVNAGQSKGKAIVGGRNDSDERPEEFVPKDDNRSNSKPLASLLPQVDAKSGEGKDVLFEAQSKLPRYDRVANESTNGEIGEIKLPAPPSFPTKTTQLAPITSTNSIIPKSRKRTADTTVDEMWMKRNQSDFTGTSGITFGTTPLGGTTTTINAPPITTAEFSSLFGLKSSITTTKPNTISTLTFGSFSALTTTSATNVTTTGATATFSFGLSNVSTTASASSFPALTFGRPATTTSEMNATSNSAPAKFSFDLSNASTTTNTNASFLPLLKFGTTTTTKPSLFGGFSSFTTTNPGQVPEKATGGDRDEGDEKPEEFVPKDDNIKPLVPLPPQVDVKSGEEGEDVIFEARSKLYRYDRSTNENKDRGIGEIKILRNTESDRYRCLMRNNETAKLIANFPIIAGIKLDKHKKPAVVTWSCRDFSEKVVDGSDELFLAKFRDEDTAHKFMAKIEELSKLLGKKNAS